MSESFTALEKITRVSLGYKSLQNNFFYVNQVTIDTYGIEERFLQPIYVFRDLDGQAYLQYPEVSRWLFVCRDKESDLRATGALKYIHAMSEGLAAQKKQSGEIKTIREALEAQGGGLWYAPKAKPHPARLWLRKAFNTVYAPFVFETPNVVDQRCNYLEPHAGLSLELLGAVLTSTIFAYAVEINGAASMGAGALEAPTSKVRRYPVFDPRMLNPKQKKELCRLTRAVWKKEHPVDWGADGTEPGTNLRALDEWLLNQLGNTVTIQQLYDDLRATCQARIAVARDKVRTEKKQKTTNIASVAKGIADHLGGHVNARQFPENFYTPSGRTIPVHVDRKLLRRITMLPLLDQAEITIAGEGGKVLWGGTYNLSVAEAIVRSVLLGRESFQIPERHDEAEDAVATFLKWFDSIRARLDHEIDESALGTGYEKLLRTQVYQRLGIHPLVGERVLPHQINFAAALS